MSQLKGEECTAQLKVEEYIKNDNLKLHLGCGKRKFNDWIHIDLDVHAHIDFQADIRKLDMIPDGSASIIYACHCLEYFDAGGPKDIPSVGVEVFDVLSEWKSKLKPGGILRLAVPDFEQLVKVYSLTSNLESVLGPIFGRWEVSSEDGKTNAF